MHLCIIKGGDVDSKINIKSPSVVFHFDRLFLEALANILIWRCPVFHCLSFSVDLSEETDRMKRIFSYYNVARIHLYPVWCRRNTWCGVRITIDKKEYDFHLENLRISLQRYRKERIKETREQILRIIRIYSIRGGILPAKLAKVIGINKKNLLPYLKRLEDEKAIERKNEQAPYFLTDKFYKDTMLIARLFGEASSKLLRDRRNLILNDDVETVYQSLDLPYLRNDKNMDSELRSYNFTKYKEFLVPKFSDNTQVEKKLFEFSNRISAFTIRALIEAMNEENYSNKVNDLVEQATMSQEYVSNALSTFVPHLLPAFKDLIENNTPGLTNEFCQDVAVNYYGWRCLECSSVTENVNKEAVERFIRNHQYQTRHSKGKWLEYEDNSSSDRNKSKQVKAKVKDSISVIERSKKNPDKFFFNDRISRKLIRHFNNIYGLSGYEFDKIIQNMPHSKESYEKFTREVHEKFEARRNCKHEFKESTMTLYGYGKQCRRCNLIEMVRENKEK